jgi:hypothetical protein
MKLRPNAYIKENDTQVMIGASKKMKRCYARDDVHIPDGNTRMIWLYNEGDGSSIVGTL